MLGTSTNLHIFERGSIIGACYCNKVLLPYVHLFGSAMGPQFLFMDNNTPPHHIDTVEELLERENIKLMDWPARSPDLNLIEHAWDFLGRHLAAHNKSIAVIGTTKGMGSIASTTHRQPHT